MPVYLIANVKITDDSWVPEYAIKVHDIVHRHGGKYLTRTGNITVIEGEAPDVSAIAILEFPTMEAAQTMYSDPEYAAFRSARIAGTKCDFYILDDVDLMGTISYLGKP